MDQLKRSRHVQPDLPEERVRRLAQERSRQRSARVRNDQSDVDTIGSGADRRQDVVRRKVERDHAIVDAELRLELCAELFQKRSAARYQNQVEAVGSELARERFADTGGRSRDEGPWSKAMRVEGKRR